MEIIILKKTMFQNKKKYTMLIQVKVDTNLYTSDELSFQKKIYTNRECMRRTESVWHKSFDKNCSMLEKTKKSSQYTTKIILNLDIITLTNYVGKLRALLGMNELEKG